MKYLKTIFYILNFFLVVFYLYPGSILGCLFYNNCGFQPQLTKDFIFSSNHFYVFFIISYLGFYIYTKNKKKILIYFLSLSTILELFHLIIPNRSFQFFDLFGNIAGVLLSILFLNIYNLWRKR